MRAWIRATALALSLTACVARSLAGEAGVPAPPTTGTPAGYPYRVLTLAANHGDTVGMEAVWQRIQRAKGTGYTHVMIVDTKLMTMDRYGYHHPRSDVRRNYQKTLELIRACGLRPVLHLATGARGGMALHENVNLAAGYPVRDVLHEIHNNRLQVVPTSSVTEVTFESEEPSVSSPEKTLLVNTDVRRSGRRSMEMDLSRTRAPHHLSRLYVRTRVKPYHHYRVTAWVKMQDVNLPNTFQLTIMNRNSASRYQALSAGGLSIPFKATSDWVRVWRYFNSFDAEEVNIILGFWPKGTDISGRAWLDDIRIETCSFQNVLRRASCPLKLKSVETGSQLREGVHFEYIDDPLKSPTGWKIDPDHSDPVVKLILNTSDGQQVEASWYHPLFVGNTQCDGTVIDPLFFKLWKKEFNTLCNITENTLAAPVEDYFIYIAEYRTGGHSKLAADSGMTGGQLLADYVRRLSGIVRARYPNARLATWFDMFSPEGNAKDDYYFFARDLRGSWEGLDPGCIIWLWGENWKVNGEFFAGRGHPIIVTYHTQFAKSREEWLNTYRNMFDWMRPIPDAIGASFLTEDEDYAGIEKLGALMRQERRDSSSRQQSGRCDN